MTCWVACEVPGACWCANNDWEVAALAEPFSSDVKFLALPACKVLYGSGSHGSLHDGPWTEPSWQAYLLREHALGRQVGDNRGRSWLRLAGR